MFSFTKAKKKDLNASQFFVKTNITHAYHKIFIVYPQQDEDYDYDDEGEPLLREGEGLAEEVELTLATDAHIDKLYD